jgi:hypothetical protein
MNSANKSRIPAKSKVSESPRRYAPRDDGIDQRFLNGQWPCTVIYDSPPVTAQYLQFIGVERHANQPHP